MRIIVVQNTPYHFETAISLYQVCKNLNFSTALHVCPWVQKQDTFRQRTFLSQHGISSIAISDVAKDDVCFAISAHPKRSAVLPQADAQIFNKLSRRLYISHRFSDDVDYSGPLVTKNNSFCLSPLAAAIGVKHLWLTDAIFKPVYTPINGSLQLSIQGHFQFKHRQLDKLNELKMSSARCRINLIGTESKRALATLTGAVNNVAAYAHISETNFYSLCNENTHFLMPMIDNTVHKQKYLKEVYSSTFNIAPICEKPIFAHKDFESVYRLPGIYYTDDDFQDRFYEMLDITEDKYRALVDAYKPLKEEMTLHNKSVLFPRVQALYNLKRDMWYG